MVVSNDFPLANYDVAKNVRQQQKRKWEESDTNKEPISLKNKSPRVKFDRVSMFLSACNSGDLDEAEQLLSYGLNINSANPDGLTALHQACIYDKLDVVEFLLNNGADINCTDPEGWTPLHCAAYCGYSDITKLLIEKHANLSALNSNCELPIDLVMDKPDIRDLVLTAMQNLKIDADSAKKSEEIQLIEDARSWLREGIKPTFRHPGSGATPLHVAAAKGYLEALQLLLDGGADIEARDNDEWTPVMAAAHWSQLGAVELLLKAGAKTNISSRMGFTLEDVVADEIHDDVKRLIIACDKLPPPVSKIEGPSINDLKAAITVNKRADEIANDIIAKTEKDKSVNTEKGVPASLSFLPSSKDAEITGPARAGTDVVSVGPQPNANQQQLFPAGSLSDDHNARTVSVRGTIVNVEDQQAVGSDRKQSSSVSSSDELSSLLQSSSANGRLGDITSRNNGTSAVLRRPLALGSSYGPINSLQAAVAPSANLRAPNGSSASTATLSTSSSLAGSKANNLLNNPLAATSRQAAVTPITSSSLISSTSTPIGNLNIVGRPRPVSGMTNSSDSSTFLTSTPKLSGSSYTANTPKSTTKSSSHDLLLPFTNTTTTTITTTTTATTTTHSTNSITQPSKIGPGLTHINSFNKINETTPTSEVPSSSSSSSSLSSSSSPPPPSSSSSSSTTNGQLNFRRHLGRRPLSTLVASEDGAANRFQSVTSARNGPVYTMVHRSASATSTRHAPASNPAPATPYPSRAGSNVLRSVVPNGKNDNINSSINTNTTTNVVSRMRTQPHSRSPATSALSVSKDQSGATSSDEPTRQLSTPGGMVAVLATPVTAVTPQHSVIATPSSTITATPASSTGGSANRSAADEAEAERKARARHNRQTRRATQGVTLEDFTQAKNIATTDGSVGGSGQAQAVIAAAAPVNTTTAPPVTGAVASASSHSKQLSSQLSSNAGVAAGSAINNNSVSTPVIGTVSPITQITPSVVFASSAMASSSNNLPSTSCSTRNGNCSTSVVTSSGGGGTTSTSTTSSNGQTATTVSAASSSAAAAPINTSSSRRRAPPRRSTGISQADVSEAAETLANSNGSTNTTTTTASLAYTNSLPLSTSAVGDIPSTSSSSGLTSSTTGIGPSSSGTSGSGRRDKPSADSAAQSGASSFLVEYDRLYELERAENERLKSQTRQVSSQLTELQRDKRSLQRRVSELEEETRELERLRAENQRLKDENCALIRVISKLSK